MRKMLGFWVGAIAVLFLVAWGAQAAEEMPALPDGVCAMVEVKDVNAFAGLLSDYVRSASAGAQGPMAMTLVDKAAAWKLARLDYFKWCQEAKPQLAGKV